MLLAPYCCLLLPAAARLLLERLKMERYLVTKTQAHTT